MAAAILDVSGGPITDRAFMTEWFQRRNQEVIDTLPPKRLLVFSPQDGWRPLCAFLEVPVPDCPFPRVNSRDELTQVSDENQGLPADPEVGMRVAREYIDQLKARAFAPLPGVSLGQNSTTTPPEGTIGRRDPVVSKTRPARSIV